MSKGAGRERVATNDNEQGSWNRQPFEATSSVHECERSSLERNPTVSTSDGRRSACKSVWRRDVVYRILEGMSPARK